MSNSDTPTGLLVGFMSGDMTKHILAFRDFALSDSSSDPGVYYFGIMASACYFESVLEEFTVLWCTRKAGEEADFRKRILVQIAEDVGRATGLDAWKKWLMTLFEVDIVKVAGDDWKALTVLFKLRNQLAHGRTTKFRHFWKPDGKFVGMSIEGSAYESVFKYLLDAKVIRLEPNVLPAAEAFLARDVVAHFATATDRTLLALRGVPVLAAL
jgi:hypothetical protein